MLGESADVMQLEDLVNCTPAQQSGPSDVLEDALDDISGLATSMNEEKRDAESRLRLFHWQQRISSRGPSPLVQPHRKLVMDGALNLIRLVKKASCYVEVDVEGDLGIGAYAARTALLPSHMDMSKGTHSAHVDEEQTIHPLSNHTKGAKTVVQLEYLAPEPMDKQMTLILCSDLMVLVQQRGDAWDGVVDLFNVLRMATLREPASIVHGNILRLVDNKVSLCFGLG
jgi:hypothetical protein